VLCLPAAAANLMSAKNCIARLVSGTLMTVDDLHERVMHAMALEGGRQASSRLSLHCVRGAGRNNGVRPDARFRDQPPAVAV
jgi:hypothetical protein